MSTPQRGALARLLLAIWRLIDGARRIVVNLLFLLIVTLIVMAVMHRPLPEVPQGGALVLAPVGVVVDQLSFVDPLTSLVDADQLPLETLQSDLVRAVDRAAGDPRIAMLVLQLDAMQAAGLSKLQELAQALERFRASGKPIVAVGDSFTQEQYWLAAQADQVFMNPLGSVLLPGYGVYPHYFRDALDKLSIDFHIFRVGTYKAAVEPLMRNDMSEASKENNRRWLQVLWSQYREAVATRRGIEPARLDHYVNQIDTVLAEQDGDGARAALAYGLIDAIKTRDEMNRWLVERVGADDDGNFLSIDHRDYLVATRRPTLPAGDAVGLIVAQGMIFDGEQDPGQIGGDSLAALIRQARDDAQIKAVVLRIDSEGGSAFASEIIRQELLALREAGKPLVVSMGSVAASGGYWIAADADQVWATPATITGSIGIFGAFPTAHRALERLGIHTDGVGTTAVADAFRIDRPLDPVVARAIQSTIEHGYRQFLKVVADGRDLSVEQVDAIGQGRIWAGSDAQQQKLVDHLGSLHDALRAAEQLVGLPQAEPRLIEPPLSAQQLLLQQLAGSVRALFGRAAANQPLAQAARWSPTLVRELDRIARLNDPRAAYLLCSLCARL
jgi:protease-4